MLKNIALIIASLLLQTALYAAEAEAEFNPTAANKLLDKLSIKLSIQNLNIESLDEAVSELSEQREQAEECTATAQGQLDEVALLISEAFPEDAPEKLTEHQKYLQDKKTALTQRLSGCQLFVLRSSEAIDAFSTTIEELLTTQIFQLETDAATNITQSIKSPEKIWDKLDTQLLIDESGLHLLNNTLLILLASFLSIGLAIGLKLKQLVTRRITPESTEVFSELLLQAFFAVSRIKATQIIFLSIIALFATILSLGLQHTPTITTISMGLLIYVTVVSIVRLIVYPPEPARGLSNLRADTASMLLHRIKLLARLALFGFVAYTLFQSHPFPDYAFDSFRTVFVTLLAFNLVSIVWLVNRIPKLQDRFLGLRILLSTLFGIGLIIILASEWVGYHNFSSYLLQSTAITLALFFVSWFLHKVITSGIDSLSGTQHAWQQRFRYHLGVKKFEGIPELSWLRAIVSVVVWGGFVVLLLKTWGLSDAQFNNMIDGIMNGFHVAGLEVIPSRIIFAVLLFAVSLALIRFTKTRFIKRSKITVDPGAREAISAVLSYAVFAFILLLALLIAGVNFAGLAIIAGALSVCVGFFWHYSAGSPGQLRTCRSRCGKAISMLFARKTLFTAKFNSLLMMY